MGIQIASVSIGTKLDLTGFNQGLGSLSSLQAPVATVKVKFDASSVEKERQQLEKLLSRNLTIKVKADHTELYELNKHIESKRNHVKDVNNWMGKNPIKVRVDDSELNKVNVKEREAEKRPTSKGENFVNSDEIGKEIEKGFSKAKFRINSGGNIFSSVFKGATEKIGASLTSSFSEGLASSLDDKLSKSVGSLDLLGRTLFDKVIPQIGSGLSKSPVIAATGKALANSKAGQAVQGVYQGVRGVIGEDEIALEQRINSSKRRTVKQNRNQNIAKELGIEYQDILVNMPMADIEQKQNEQRIKQLESAKQRAFAKMVEFQAKTTTEKASELYDKPLQGQIKRLKKIKEAKRIVEKKAIELIHKEDEQGGLSKSDTNLKAELETEYESLEKNEKVTKESLKSAGMSKKKFSKLSDEDKEIVVNAAGESKINQVVKIEKQLEELRKRVESAANEKSEVERLLEEVGVSLFPVRNAEALKNKGVANFKIATLNAKSTNNDKVKKATALMAASQKRVKEFQQLMIAAQEKGSKEQEQQIQLIIDKEQQKQAGYETLIKSVENFNKEADSGLENFVVESDQLILQEQGGIVKQVTGKEGDSNEIMKRISIDRLKALEQKHKNAVSKLRELDFKTNEEAVGLIGQASAIAKNIAKYEKQADAAIKMAAESKKKNATIQASQVTVMGGGGLRYQALPDIPKTYSDIAKDVLSLSPEANGLNIPIPSITAFSPKEMEHYKNKGIDARASYDSTKNQVQIRPEQFQALKDGNLDEEGISSLTHELRHWVQTFVKDLEKIRPSAEEFKQNPDLAKRIEASTSNSKGDKNKEQHTREDELDAYTFQIRNTSKIAEKVKRNQSIREIEQQAGAGGGKMLMSINKAKASAYQDLSGRIEGKGFDVGKAADILENKFQKIDNIGEKYLDQLRNIENLSQDELEQLKDSISGIIEKLSGGISGLAKSVEGELENDAKKDLLAQLKGGSTTKKQLQEIAKANGVQTDGLRKAEIAKVLTDRVPLATLKSQAPQPTKAQQEAILAAQTVSPQEVLGYLKGRESDKLNFEELQEDYALVLEFLNQELDDDIRKFLKGAKLRLGKQIKSPQKEQSSGESLGDGVLLQASFGDYAKEARERLLAMGQPIGRFKERRKIKASVGKSNKANVKAAQAMAQVYEASLNKMEATINQAVSSFEENEAEALNSAQKYIQQRLVEYEKMILQAERNAGDEQNRNMAYERRNIVEEYQKNQKLLSENELKGEVVNYDPLKTPQAVKAMSGAKPGGDGINLIGEALGDLFGGIAKKIRKQSEILLMHTPSLMGDIVNSAVTAGQTGDTDEQKRLMGYHSTLQSNQSRSKELSQQSKLSPEETKELQGLNMATQDIFKSLNVAVPEVNGFFDAFAKGGGILGNVGGMLKNAMAGFFAFQGLTTLRNILSQFTGSTLEAATSMESLERKFTFVSGSAQKGAANLAFVRGEVKRLGTDIKSSMQGFTSLAASTKDTALEGQTQKIFTGVSQASTVYDLNSEQQGRVFTAVQQMASKGKVSAEELRQQLGESLPGAFQIAARAMGMTTTALDKMMKEGKLLSEEFLPKFADQLSAETALGVKGAANSSVSALIGFNNALFEMQATLGKTILPVRNFLLSLGGKAFEFISQNAELLLRVFQALSVIIGIKLVGSFAQLAASLMKIPVLAKIATTAMSAFASSGDNKLRATQMVENAGGVFSNPVSTIKQSASNLVDSVKDFGTVSLDSAKNKLSTLGASINNFRTNSLSSLSSGFGSAANNAKAFGKAALVNGVAGMMGLAQGARALISALSPMLKMFIAIELGTAVFKGIQAAFSDSSGASREFADTAVENLEKYKKALSEARGETQKFKSSTQVRDESLLDEMGIGGLLPKSLKEDAGWFDKLRFGTGKVLTGLVEAPANLLKMSTGGRVGATYEDKKLSDNLISVNDARVATNSTSTEMLTMLGKKGQGTQELGEIKKYDNALREIQTKRAALVAINPENKAGLKLIDEEQNRILTKREKVSKPIGMLQANMQTNIDGIKKEIEKYEKLANEPGKNQSQYKEVLGGLKGDLSAAEKIQDRFNKSVGESVNSFTLMQRNIQGVADKLADAEDKSVLLGNSLKSKLYSQVKSQGELQFGLSDIELKQQESKLARLVEAKNQTSALLQNKDAQNTLNAYGVTENTGKAELKTLADKTGDRVNDKYVLEQYASLQEKNIEISNLQTGLAQSKQELTQKVYELNKQVNEYYRSAAKQFAESSLQFQQQSSQLKTQSYATELKSAINGFSDNIVTTFVDNIIDSIQQLSDAADKKFDIETAVLQADNQLKDALKQGDELKRQLPKYEIGGSDAPTIPVSLDFSTVGKNADLDKLNNEIGKTVDKTKELTALSSDYPGLINESVGATQSLGVANTDVVNNVKDLETSLGDVNISISGNIDSASDLGVSFGTNIGTAFELGGQIDTNTKSIQSNNSAVLDVDTSLNTAIATTGNVDKATVSWLGTTGRITTEINTNVSGGLTGVMGSIEGITTKTIDWFKTFANNIPILNQLGQIFAGWGQQLSGVAQSITGLGTQGASATMATNAASMLGQMGQGVGNVGKYDIFDSNYGHNVASYEKLSRHHALRGIENRDYGNHGGKQEEVRKTSDGRELVKKDFVLEKNGSSAVDIPAMATGYIQRMYDATDGVRIYADKAMTKLVGQSLHMKNISVKDGDFVRYGQRIGTQGDTGSPGAIHAHIEMELNAFKQYIQDLKDGVFEGSQQTSVTEQKHSLGDGHNHYGEEDIKKANLDIAKNINASPSGNGMMQLNKADSPNKGADQFVGAVLSILEAPTRQGRVDVAQVISNRVGNNFGGYGASIRDQGFASGQFQPFFKETYGIGKNDIKDQSSAVTALKKAGYSTQQAESALNDFFADINDAAKVADSQSKVAGRAYFKGTSEQRHMRGDDFLRNKNENFFHYEDSDPNRKMKAIKDVFGGASALNNLSLNGNVQPTGTVKNWETVPTPGVWTPNGMVGGRSPLTQVNAKGNEAVNKATGMAEIQRARQIELSEKKASNDAATATVSALKNSNKAFKDLEKGLRENGLKVNSLSGEVTDTNEEYSYGLDTEQKRQQAQRNLIKKYDTLENTLIDQRKELDSQVQSAKAILDKGGIVTPEMKTKVQSMVDSPLIGDTKTRENLKDQLQKALTTGALGEGGTKLLERAISEGQAQVGKIDTSLDKVRKGKGDSKAFLDEKFAREEKLRKQSAGFDIESASIDVLKAKMEQLQALQSRSPFAPEVKAVPSIQKVIAAREEQLRLEQKIKEVEEKENTKVYTKTEADALRKEVSSRKAIVDETIKSNAVQAEAVLLREAENRNREASIELANAELGKDRQKLEQLKLVAQTNPLSPELSNSAIPQLEKKITLKEAELKLTQDIAAIEQEAFENKRTPEEVAKKKAATLSAYEAQVKNINAQSSQAIFANEIAQQKTILEIKKQQLDYQTSTTEATSKAINLGLKQGDPLKLNYDSQRAQMQLSVESQVLEMKEFANKTGKSRDEVALLEKQIRDLNGLNLGNLAAEFKKSVDDRAFGIRQRLGSSGTEVLEAKASFYSGRGMNFKAQGLQRQSAMIQQQSSYEGQKRDLEEFIKTNQVASDAAQQLRNNLEAVNQVKFDTIKDNFNTFKPVIDSVGTAIEDGLVNVFKTGKFDVNVFFDTIFSSMAKLAASWLKEQLLGSIMGKGKNEGKGGMFAEKRGEEGKLDPLSALIGGEKSSSIGLSPVAPMYVNVVNSGAFGGLMSASPMSDLFGKGNVGGSNGSDFISSVLGGNASFDKSNPIPVGIEKSSPDAFSSLGTAISGIFGGSSGGGGVLSGITGLLGGSSGGGLGGILGMIMPLFGGLFAEGGIIGGSARSKKDDQLILAQKGEGILTHKGMDAIGGSAVLGAINDGRLNLPKFADGGVVGGGYVSNTAEYGSSSTTDKVSGRASEPREVNVKMETTSINGVEYLTKAQGQELAQKAAQEGAKNGAKYVSDRLMNSPQYRNRHGMR